MQVVVQGLLTAYDRMGAGKQVLIIPGWADTSASWQAVAHRLANTYEVIIMNPPGFGGSEAPHEAWGVTEYANFTKDFVTKLGLDLFALVGHSNGGAISMQVVGDGLLYPDRLALVASAGIRQEAGGRKLALKVAAKAGKVITRPLPSGVRQKLRRKLYQGAGSDMLVAEHMQESFKKVIVHDVRQTARRIAVPTVLIYGDKDDQTPLRYAELFHDTIPGSKIVTIAGAGHFLHVDRPVEVESAVKEFLQS